MADITVTSQGGSRWRVEVREGSSVSTHTVTLTPEDHQRLAPGTDAEELIRESFRFLLEREPKEAILPSFELPVIARYFPEYPEQIPRRVG